MTVGLVVRVPGAGAVLACDSRITTSDGAIVTDTDTKWAALGPLTLCSAGNWGGAWLDLIARGPTTIGALRAAMREAPHLDADEYEALCYSRQDDSLWHLDQSGDATRLGGYAAIGCGGALALGALDATAAPRTLEAAERLARRAVGIACRRHSACGGRVRVVTIPGKRGPLRAG